MDAGIVVETGSHHELMVKKGHYYNLVQAQQLHSKEGNTDANAHKEHTDQVDVDAVVIAEISKDVATNQRKADETKMSDEKPNSVSFSQVPLLRIAAMNRPEWHLILVGTIGGAISGAIFPLFALIYSEMLNTFTKPKDDMLVAARFWALMFFVIAVASGLGMFLQIGMFGTLQ